VTSDFARAYPTTSNADLARTHGVSERTIARWAARLGLRKTAEHRSRMSREVFTRRDPNSVVRGAKHWNWKGGRTWERFRDPRYLSWRKAVLERDGYRCQSCGRQCRKHEKGLAAHHIEAWSDAPTLRFDIDNGMTLCRQCHMSLHGLAPKPIALIACACGCGELLPERDIYGRPRRFVNGHGKRGTTMSAAARERLSRDRRGRPLTKEHRAKIATGLRTSTKRIGRPPRGA
jgi:hypothetical protein